MAATPPPPPGPSDRSADQAARLEQLARRRAASGASSSPLSDERARRLEQLAQRTRPASPSADERPRRRGRRAHPAKGARKAALGMSLVTTAGLAGLFAVTGGSASASADSSAMIVSGTGTAGTAGRSSSPASSATTGSATAASTTTTAPAQRSIDLVVPTPDASTTTTAPSTTVAAQPTVVDGGTYRNRWGNVQVEATFSPDGQLVDVVALQYPNDRGQSIRINQYAIPRLTSEALSSQSASVHSVSGATYTSDGYRKSLQSAIDVARQAGVTAIS